MNPLAIEDIFSSKGRVKILKILTEVGELNISEIARRAGLNYSATSQHLQILEKHRLILHKRFGRIRIFRLDEANPKVDLIKHLLGAWEKDKSRTLT